MKKHVSFTVLICLLLNSCTNTLTPPIVRTLNASANSATTITATGKILTAAGSSIVSFGFCLSKDSLPTIRDTKIEHFSESYVPGNEFSDSFTGLTMNETYYIRAYAINSDGVAYGKSIRVKTYFPITLSTQIPTTITLNSAVCNGNISNDSRLEITTSGFCWRTTTNPTINDNITINKKEVGVICDTIRGLKFNTTYYIKAYATTNNGTIYGNEVSFQTLKWDDATTVTDIDGNIYHTVSIGTQVWLVENLRTTRYRNGDLIGTTSADISNEESPKYQWPCSGSYDSTITNSYIEQSILRHWTTIDVESFNKLFGNYYTWYAANDSRSICPVGWHVPSKEEWMTLYNNMKNIYGYQSGVNMARSLSSTSGWIWSCDEVTNNSSFTALPASYLYDWFLGAMAYWWSSSEYNSTTPYFSILYTCDFSPVVYKLNGKKMGMCIRCLAD